MTKEDAIKYLQQLYPNGGHCWLDEQRIEAIGMAIKALKEEPNDVVDKYLYGKEPKLVDEDDLPKKNYRERYKRIAESEEFRKNYDGMSIGDIVPVEEQEPASEDLEKIVEEIAEPTILNAYGTKELARRLRNTICGTSVSEGLEEASKNYALNNTPWDDCKDEIQESFKAGAQWQKEKNESTTEDLGEYINELSKQFPEVSFAKLSRIAVRVAKWQKENLWKPADDDDLPIIDREVIALLDNGKVVFAHRPPEYWDGKDIVTGKVTRNYPKTYDKGGWNIPDVKFWLDVKLPKEIAL